MKTTRCLLASAALIIFAPFTLHATEYQTGTFFLQSLGGTQGPPYPYDPTFGTVPMTEIGPDKYVIQDGDSESFQSGGLMAMDSIDPGDTNNVGTNGYDYTPPPNIRNYAKYGAQIFSLLDTNSVLNDGNDTNLYNACVAINGSTNGLPWLTVAQYGPGAVIIRADNFDYTQTNVDLALLVCDKVETPTWKAIDFSGASDAQDGWLVQGTVPYSQVTSTMFMLVTNINTTYNAFFRVMPYDGPQVVITGTNQPYDTVSNLITLITQIYDLSGTTNEGFLVDVNGDAVSTHSSLSNNAITLDTKYNPNGQDYGIDNVDLTVQGFASVYGYTTNAPGDTKLIFTSATSIPLDFENVNYLLFQSALAERDIGTNTILFVCNKEEDFTCTISDPSSNVVASYAGHIPGPVTVEIDWNFTEADGVTPYSNSTYIVHFTASDPDDFLFPNQIANNDEIRKAAGCYITYEQEPTITTEGEYTDEEDHTWLNETLTGLYQDLYFQDGITEYLNSDIGANRDYSDCQGLIQNFDFPRWADFMGPALSNSYTSFVDGLDYPRYSDLTIGGAHGTGTTIGGYGAHSIPWLADEITPPLLQSWLQAPSLAPQWRLRKAALWACLAGEIPVYSAQNPGPNGETNPPVSFPLACGIRYQQIQERNYIRKNTCWLIDGLLPQRLQGPGSVDSSAQVAEEADELWVCGANAYPGGCDPTYSSYWVVQQMQGMYPVLAPGASANLDIFGYLYLPYTSIYDDQLEMLDHHNVKTR
jgi:hypothetical protein